VGCFQSSVLGDLYDFYRLSACFSLIESPLANKFAAIQTTFTFVNEENPDLTYIGFFAWPSLAE
jgi:hypothetical protein